MCNFLFFLFNIQVASGGKLPMKPRDCNCGHIPKALEHTTGLPNPQLSPPHQAPITHKPNGSLEKKYVYIPKSGGKVRNRREPL